MTTAAIGRRRPLTTLALAGVITLLALLGIGRLRIETSLGAMLDPGRPVVRATEVIGERFAAGHELLIVLWPADDPAPADEPAHAARRIAEALRAADTTGSIRDVRIDRGGRWGDDIAAALAPAALYYTDDAGFEQALRRLQPAAMRARLDRLETLLAAPGNVAAAAAEEAAADPLGIRELVARSGLLAAPAAASAAPGAGPGAAEPTILRVTPTAGGADLHASEALTQLAQRAIEAAGATAEITGAPAIAALASRSIRGDMQRAIISSAILIQVVFLLAYRRPLTLLVVSLPAAIGVVWAFGAMGVVAPELTALTAAIGGALAGLGVDYAIHLASASRGETTPDAAPDATRRVRAAIICAAITSVLGFAALAFSGLAMLRGLALIGALGLAGAMIATLWVGPALLRLARGAEARDGFARAAVAGVARRPRVWLSIAGAVAVIAAAGAGARFMTGGHWLEAASEIVHPEPNPPLRAQERLAAAGLAPATLPVLVQATPADLLERCRQAEAALAGTATGAVAITGVLGPHTLVPAPSVAARRATRLAALNAEQVAAEFRSAVAESALSPEAFEGYEQFLGRLLSEPAPTLETIHDAAARAGLLPDSGPPDAGLVLVRLSQSPATSGDRRQLVDSVTAALAESPDATLAGPVTMGAEAFSLLARDLPRLAAMGAALALVWLLIFFRRPADVALAAAPAIFAAIALLGAMSALGWRFNLINMAALPLLAGIGVDDGVFLVAASRDRAGRLLPRRELLDRLGASAHAITVTTMTTSLAFGSLILTSVPGMRSLGLLIATGAVAALCGSVLLLVPALALRAPADSSGPAAE